MMIDCPACQEHRVHTVDDWANHPLAGHGYTLETGWTKEEAKQKSEEEREPKT